MWNKVTEAAWLFFENKKKKFRYGIDCAVAMVTELPVCGYLSSN